MKVEKINDDEDIILYILMYRIENIKYKREM